MFVIVIIIGVIGMAHRPMFSFEGFMTRSTDVLYCIVYSIRGDILTVHISIESILNRIRITSV